VGVGAPVPPLCLAGEVRAAEAFSRVPLEHSGSVPRSLPWLAGEVRADEAFSRVPLEHGGEALNGVGTWHQDDQHMG